MKVNHELLCNYGKDKVTKLLTVLKEAQQDWQKIEKVFVYSENKYNRVASMIATTFILGLKKTVLQERESFPITDVTSNPNVVPVTLRENIRNWSDIEPVAVLPGWDFYDLHWLFRHWEKSLGNFDFDSFLHVPSYPRDVYNNNIHPDIVIFLLNQYVSTYTLQRLKENFFGLYQFCKDNLGKKLLVFFYECTEQKLSRKQIYTNLHAIYHSTCPTHPFRIYLYYLNKGLQHSSPSKKYFKVQLFISQYLSYEGMFVCNNYLQQRLAMIVVGMYDNYRWLQCSFDFTSLQHLEDVLLLEWQHLYESFPVEERLTWVGKIHLQKLQKRSSFWKNVLLHWHHFNRNIFLWENKSQKYGDSQLGTGYPLVDYFPQSWTENFEKVNYVPVEVNNTRRKRKL